MENLITILTHRNKKLHLRFSIFILCLTSSTLVNAQNPGGVENSTFWIRATSSIFDAGGAAATANNTAIGSWASGGSIPITLAQATTTRQPRLRLGTTGNEFKSFNYNPYLSFNAGSSQNLSAINNFNLADISALGGSFFIVHSGATGNVSMEWKSTTGRLKAKGGGAGPVDPKIDGPIVITPGDGSGFMGNQYTALGFKSTANLISFRGSTTVAPIGKYDGFLGITSMNNIPSSAPDGIVIGSNAEFGEYFAGGISEIISFPSILTAQETARVESYLAIKYGISLDQTIQTNYVDSAGGVIWDANTIYKNNITAIGRDDASGLLQKQSISSKSTGMVSISKGAFANTNGLNAGSFAADKDFLFIADNDGSVTNYTTSGAPTDRKILSRIWRVSELGTDATNYTIQVPDDSSTLTTKLPTEVTAVYLLQDTDTDFSTGATSVTMVANSTNWRATNIDLDNGRFFTFATGLTVLDQIGLEADSATITSVVTVAQLNTISPSIADVVSANQLAYQNYIDNNPNAFSAPATQTEVQAMVTLVNSLEIIKAYATSNTNPEPTEATYTAAGITGVTAGNIAAVNAAIDAAATVPTTAAQIQAIVDGVVATQTAVSTISTYAQSGGTAPTEATYTAAGITGVTSGNIAAVNAAILASDGAGTATAAQIQAIVDGVVATQTAVGTISTYAQSGGTAPTEATYTAAGITGVTAGNIAAVNAAILASDAAGTDTAAEIQAIVDGVVATQTAVGTISTYAQSGGTPPTEATYTAAGITGVTAGNIEAVNAAILASDAAGTDTAAEIQAIVDGVIAAQTAVSTISTYAQSGGTVPTEATYTAAGITGVTAGNIAAVNAAILASDAAGTDTAAEIQAIVDGVVAAQTAVGTISTYAQSGGTPPTEATYTAAGITGVTAGNIEAVNAAILASDAAGTDTAAEIQAIVDGVIAAQTAVGTISTYAQSGGTAPTEATYTAAGITGVTAGNLAAVNAAILASDGAGTDTAAEIQAIVDGVIAAQTAVGTISTYAQSGGTAPTEATYTAAGITGVTSGNIAAVNAAILASDGAGTATAAQIQAIVDGVVATQTAVSTISTYAQSGGTAPTEATYTAAGITGVTSGNIAAVNAAILASDGAGTATAAQIQAIVDGVVATQTAVSTISTYAQSGGTAPTEANYTAAGITGVTAGNISAINAAILASDAAGTDTAAEIQAIVDGVVAAQTALGTISTYAQSGGTAPTEATYTAAGITGVTAANIAAVNAAILASDGSGTDTALEIQAIVNAVLASNVVLAQIGADADNTATNSTITIAQLQAIVPAITGIIPANLASYQLYIDTNANLFSNPATAAQVQAAITAANNTLSTENFESSKLKVYPMPVIDVLNISYSKVIENVVVYNVIGKEILNVKSNALSMQIDLSSLSDGMYIVKIFTGNTNNTINIIKNR
jgi:hypothetical protein